MTINLLPVDPRTTNATHGGIAQLSSESLLFEGCRPTHPSVWSTPDPSQSGVRTTIDYRGALRAPL